jgi:ribulose 1,5-bisphosphate synthetase/thiazole synthase
MAAIEKFPQELKMKIADRDVIVVGAGPTGLSCVRHLR